MADSLTPDLLNDPDVLALAPVLERLREENAGLKIISQSHYLEQAERLKDVKAALDKIKAQHEKIYRPAKQSIDALAQQRDEALAPFLMQEAVIKQAMVTYAAEQKRITDEKNAKARDEAAKKQAELDKKAAAARAKGKEDQADLLEQRAAAVVPAVLQAQVPKVAGISHVKRYGYTITDESKLPREYLEPSHKKIGGVVRAMKDLTNIPGVEVQEITGIAAGKS